MNLRRFLAVGVCLLAGSYASGVMAVTDPTCVPNAAAVKKACKAECVDDFLTTKFVVCKGLDPTCVSAAVATKLSCIDAAKLPLQTCFGTCTDSDPVVVASCRDACRGTFYTTQANLDALKACRETFRTNIKACAPLAP